MERLVVYDMNFYYSYFESGNCYGLNLENVSFSLVYGIDNLGFNG